MSTDTVLIVTTSYDDAPEYVGSALESYGVPYFRLDTDRFPTEIRATFDPQGELTICDGAKRIKGSAVKSVWYRRSTVPNLPDGLTPGVREFCERETRAFLEGVLPTLPARRWMSPIQAIWRAERKPYQLHAASQLGFQLPPTLVTNEVLEVQHFAVTRQLIAKAVSAGYVKSPNGNQAIFTTAIADSDLEDLRGLVLAPVTFQELVEKSADIRVTVVAGKVYAAEILSQSRDSSRVDWRATDDPHIAHKPHDLPFELEDLCRSLLEHLGLTFGAIDLALTPDGNYVFFEINPSGEWLWIEDQLGFPISTSIASWLSE